MGFWQKFLGLPEKSQSVSGFRHVNWSEIDARFAALQNMAVSSDQATAKQGLIQSDSLFDTILRQTNLNGATMGERLKSLKGKLDRDLYNKIWQAHLKRNELVHEPGSFVADWEKKEYSATYKEVIDRLKRSR